MKLNLTIQDADFKMQKTAKCGLLVLSTSLSGGGLMCELRRKFTGSTLLRNSVDYREI